MQGSTHRPQGAPRASRPFSLNRRGPGWVLLTPKPITFVVGQGGSGEMLAQSPSCWQDTAHTSAASGPFTWISPRGSADDQGGPWPKSPSLCRAQTAAPRRDGSSSFGARLVSASSRLLGRLRRCSRSSAPPGAGPAPAGSGVPKSGQGSVRNRRRRGLPPRCSAPGSPHRPPAGSS